MPEPTPLKLAPHTGTPRAEKLLKGKKVKDRTFKDEQGVEWREQEWEMKDENGLPRGKHATIERTAPNDETP